MKLKTAIRISDMICVTIVILVIVIGIFPKNVVVLWNSIVMLLVALAVVNIAFCRCPNCRGQLTRWDTYCRSCGKKLEK